MKTKRRVLNLAPWAIIAMIGVARAGGLQGTGATISAAAGALLDVGGQVDVSASSAPSAGDVLTATDASHAAWTTPTGGGGGGGGVTSLAATSPVAVSGSTGAVTISLNTVPYNLGGTGQTSYATGDIVYASATNTLSKLTAGTNGYVLTLASGVPSWAPGGGGGGSTYIPQPFRVGANGTHACYGGCTDGTLLWAASYVASKIVVYDPTTRTLTHIISAGVGQGPTGVSFLGGYIWVANSLGGTVLQIDPSAFTVLNTITVGSNPQYIAGNSSTVWVTNYSSNTVSEIDIATATVTHTITVQANPEGICYDGTYLWAVNSSTGSVSQITASAHTVANNVSLTGNCAQPCFDGASSIWVTSYSSNAVCQVDIASHTMTNTVSLGTSTGPYGICFDGNYVWASSDNGGAAFPAGSCVWKIDPATATVVNQIPGIGSTNSFYDMFYDSGTKSVWATDVNTGIVVPFVAH